ncbi:MAG: hypothetical protein IK095_01410 [Oscillospiraceae bacterium]|nr:hypothetical protein [Oscillospiraceae bacterium]
MAERYRKLFHLEHRLWTPGAPVVLESGSLLEDLSSGDLLCQLRILNIQPRPIKALRAVVQMLDAQGEPLGNGVDHRYQELTLERDGKIGRDEAIVLPSRDARSFTARISQVSFADGEVWTDQGQDWTPLQDRVRLEERLDPPEEDRFRARFGKESVFAPADDGGLWSCTCGALNLAEETRCHLCRHRASVQLELLADLLGQEPPPSRSARRARPDEDGESDETGFPWSRDPADGDAADELDEDDAPAEAPVIPFVRKWRWAIWLLLLLILGGLAAGLLLPKAQATLPQSSSAARGSQADAETDLYEQALSLLDTGDFRGAVAAFHGLGVENGKFPISRQQEAYRFACILQERAEAGDANALLLIGRSADDAGAESAAVALYEAAEAQFLALGDLEDSAERARQCREALDARDDLRLQTLYDSATALLEDGDYSASHALFLSLGEFRDSPDMAKEPLYRRALALYSFAEDNAIGGICAALNADSCLFSMPQDRALALGAQELERLKAACGTGPARILIEETPSTAMPPLDEALSACFRSLGDYKDSAELAESVRDFGDASLAFFRLCAESDMEGARDWLDNGPGRFEDRERWRELLDLYSAFDREWALSTGDPTLIPMVLGDDRPCYQLRSVLILERDGAALRLCPGEDETQYVELRAELGETQFVLHEDKGGYFAELSPLGRLSVIRFLDGAVLGGAEYEPK